MRTTALELVALVLIRLTRLHQTEARTKRQQRESQREVHRTHERIAEALFARGATLARRRTQRHLDSLGRYLR